MNSEIAACGHSVVCVGAPGSAARIEASLACPECRGPVAWSVEGEWPGNVFRSVQCGSAEEARRVYRRWVSGGRCVAVSALKWFSDASFDLLYSWERYEIEAPVGG